MRMDSAGLMPYNKYLKIFAIDSQIKLSLHTELLQLKETGNDLMDLRMLNTREINLRRVYVDSFISAFLFTAA